MSKINTNMAGVTTLYHLRNKEEGMNKALERISSGLRLNHAVDDAAGASIVNRMTSQIKGLEAAIRNAADAISLTQTAEGAIEEVTQILHRMRELSVQSANGVYTGQDRQAIQNEVGALQEELHRIAESSTFNGVKMLNGDFLDTTFQVGFQPNDTANLSIEDVKPTGLGEYILKTSTTNADNMLTVETSGTAGSSSIVGANITASSTEAYEITIPAPASGTRLEAFANANTGGTYTLTGADAANFTINATTGVVTSTSMQSFDSSVTPDNQRDLNRVYTAGTNVFTESIDLTITEDTSKNTSRSATTEIDVNTQGLAGTVTLNAIDGSPGSSTQGALSLQLSDFVDNYTTGTFSLSGAGSGYSIDATSGEISISSAITSDTTFSVLFTADNGDVFTETVVLDHDAAHKSRADANVTVETTGSSNATFDLSIGSNSSTAFSSATSGSTTLTFGTTVGGVTISGNDVVFDFTNPALATGSTVSFSVIVDDSGTEKHEEFYTFTVGTAGANAVTFNSSTDGFTAATADGSQSNTNVYTSDFANTSSTASTGTINMMESEVSAVEGAKVKIETSQFTNEFTSFLSANTGGTYTITGTDADLFRIDATTGEVKSKSFLDFEKPSDAGTNGTYDINIVYTAGTSVFTEKVELSVTNDTADDNPTQAAAKPLLGTDRDDAANIVDEGEDLTIYGNVGTVVIDVNGGASAYEVVSAINAKQGESGVYANAQTRVNLSFPDQDDITADTVTFTLWGKNDKPVTISANIDFGQKNGRDANLRNLADAINNSAGKTGITAKVSTNGATVHVLSNEGYDVVVENYTLSVLDVPMNVSATNDKLENIGESQQLRKGVGNNDTFRSTGEITFHSPYIFSIDAGKTGINGGGLFQTVPGAASLSSVAELDVLTVENAKKMLTAVDGALVRIDLERSDLGATMSRMEHTINNLSNIIVNTKAARSRIQDADIAEETTNMTKAQVLSQAAQAMLAQANRTSQSILTLLQG